MVLGPELWVRALASRGSGAWYGSAAIFDSSRKAARFWFLWIANPIFQYMHMLWYARFLMFGAMLARIAALDLHLVARHPDHAAGLGLLGEAAWYAFMTLIAAEGATVAGVLANRIFLEGRALTLSRWTS